MTFPMPVCCLLPHSPLEVQAEENRGVLLGSTA